jgi:two-component system chemotaxis response regulator CheY
MATATATATKVLVVDEFPSMRRIVKNVLEHMDINDVDEADDGEDAWPMLQQGGYSLLISDWNMPGMDGLTLLKNVRGNRRLADLPVLLLSSAVNKEQLLEATRHKVNGFLIKPFETEALTAKLQQLLPAEEQTEEPESIDSPDEPADSPGADE